MNSNVFFIIVCVFMSCLGHSQDYWSKINNNIQADINEIQILRENNLFASCPNNSEVLVSLDQGKSWQNKARHQIQYIGDNYYKEFFTDQTNTLFYTICGFSGCLVYKYINDKFEIDSSKSPIGPMANIRFNSKQEYFSFNYKQIYSLHENWSRKDTIFSTTESIVNLHFITQDTCFISTIDRSTQDQLLNIYKFSIATKSISLYSSTPFFDQNNILFTENGDIFNLYNGELFYTSSLAPFGFQRIDIDSTIAQNVILNLGKSLDNQIYALTQNGIYFLGEKNIKNWKHNINLSNDLPDNITKIIIKDSTTAMLTRDYDCQRNECYFITESSKKWEKLQTNLSYNTISSLKNDSKDRYYANIECLTSPVPIYKESEDQCRNWATMSIEGQIVESIEVNKNGEPVAVSANKIFIRNSNAWIPANISNIVKPNIRLKFLYSSNGELFLDADSEIMLDRKYYLFNSTDGGYTWREITSFQKASALNTSGHYFLVTNEGKWIAYGPILGTVLNSFDRGNTWVADPAFVGCTFVRHLIQIEANKYLISCKYNGKNSLYYVEDYQQPVIVNSYFTNYPIVYYWPPSTIIGYTDGNKGIFISNDLGKTIKEVEKGLHTNITDRRYYNGLFLDQKKSQVIASIDFDGLYLSTPFLFSNTKESKKSVTPYHFTIENKVLKLRLSPEIVQGANCFLQLVNTSGQNILQFPLLSEETAINLENYPAGLYIGIIKKENQVTGYFKTNIY